MAPLNVSQAVQSCYELLLWLIPQLDKFPRVRRYTLGERIEVRSSRPLEISRSSGSINSPHASRTSGRTEMFLNGLYCSVHAEPVEARASSFLVRHVLWTFGSIFFTVQTGPITQGIPIISKSGLRNTKQVSVLGIPCPDVL